MSIDAEEEFTVLKLEAFECFVVGAGQDHLPVLGQGNGFDGGRVRLDYLGVPFHGVVPDPDCRVLRPRHDCVAARRDCDRVNRTCMSNEAEWSHIRLEIPNHDSLVARSTNDLAQIWVEACRENCILVALE
jgi:hypothetical protein